MQTFSSTGTERSQVVEKILEDIPGGGVVKKSDFQTGATGMKEGALLGVDSSGIYHITKTVMVYNAMAAAAVSGTSQFLIYNKHDLKAGEYLQNTSNTASGALIASIAASGASTDVITLGALNVALSASGILIQAATGTARALGFMYTPVAIATNPIDLTNENNGCGLLVRGTVRTENLPCFVDSTIKALLPLIRFV
jgi:Zn-dependent alcohol dehydrogenase